MAFALHVLFLLLISFSLQHVQSYAINGVAGGVDRSTGEQPARLEFTAFSKLGPAFDLFIIALQQFQQTNQSREFSYYQVAGTCTWPKEAMWVTANSNNRYTWPALHILGRSLGQQPAGLLYPRLDPAPAMAPSLCGFLRGTDPFHRHRHMCAYCMLGNHLAQCATDSSLISILLSKKISSCSTSTSRAILGLGLQCDNAHAREWSHDQHQHTEGIRQH